MAFVREVTMKILLAILLPASVYAAKPQPILCGHPLIDMHQKEECMDSFNSLGEGIHLHTPMSVPAERFTVLVGCWE